MRHAHASYRLILLAALLALAVPACNYPPRSAAGAGTAAAKHNGPPPKVATIAYIGGLRGFQRPCGCDSHQSGGLPRLGSALEQLRAPEGSLPEGVQRTAAFAEGADASAPLFILDCGSFAMPESHYPDLRVQTHLQILQTIGASGAILGSAELALKQEDALAALAKPPVPLASCNIELKLDGVKVEPYLTLCPGWYVVGVTAWENMPGQAPPSWWKLSDPVASAQAVLAKLPQDAHVVVSALGQPPEVVAKLAALPVAAVIGEAGGQAPRDGATVLPPPVARVTTLTLAQFAPERRVPLAWSLELTEAYPDAAAVTGLLAAEQTATRERLGLAKKAGKDGWKENQFTMSGEFMPKEEEQHRYVGADACVACHMDAYQTWLKSRHSQALASLAEKGEQETLDCLQCHTVALLQPDGYDPLEPRNAVGAVSCESCHGPGRLHVALMQKGAPQPGSALKIKRGTTADCLQCHDDFNSPSFALPGFWEMIKH